MHNIKKKITIEKEPEAQKITLIGERTIKDAEKDYTITDKELVTMSSMNEGHNKILSKISPFTEILLRAE